MFDKFDICIYLQYLPLYETSPVLRSSGSTNLLWNVSPAVPHSVLRWCGAKGGNHPLTSDFLGICFVFTIVIASCIQNRVNSVTFPAFSKVYDTLLCKTH